MSPLSISEEKMLEILGEAGYHISNEQIQTLQEFLNAFAENGQLAENEFYDHLFSRIEDQDIRERLASIYVPDHFYQLGKKLLKNGKREYIESYFEVFRSTKFLTRIYDDNRWPDLIHELLDKTNYTFPRLFNHRVRNYGNKIIITIMESESQMDITWREVSNNVTAISRGLYAILGENPSTQKIAFLCENSIDMVYFDLACLTSGIVNIMIPANSVPAQIAYILKRTEPSAVVVSGQIQLDKIREIRKDLQFLKSIIIFFEPKIREKDYISIKQLKKAGEQIEISEIESITEKLKLGDLASVMFTSGTTGNPKGIMFAHRNIVFKRFARAMAIPEIGEQDIFLSYLPLYHTFGRWFEMTGSMFWNARYTCMENASGEAMVNNMQRIRPSIFISIPKKWYQLVERISKDADLERDDDEKILKAIKQITGGKLRWGLSAAGHLDSEVFQFFQRYGIELMSGFGMTEATGGITMTPPGKYIPNSLGKELPGIQIKMAEDGELLIKGPYVMTGYFNPEESDVEMEDGWLPTGDIMKRDENGFIQIIDRKKEIYKNIKGETIAPQKIENFFSEFEFIKNVFLVGDHRYYNTVLIYPNFESTQVDFSAMNNEEINNYFSSVIVSVNKFLAPFERIVDYRVIDREFDAAKGELTPKGTYRRLIIEKNFADVINPMYSKTYISINCTSIEIRIPNWFLRDMGLTAHEITYSNNVLHLKDKKWELTIDAADDKIQIGQFQYKITGKFLDFGKVLNNPLLWLGNEQLVNFTGENIFKWSRMEEQQDSIMFISTREDEVTEYHIKEQLQLLLYKKEYTLLGLHLSALGLVSKNYDEGQLAVEYLDKVADENNIEINSLAVEILKRSIKISNINIQRLAYCALIDSVSVEQLYIISREFFAMDTYFVNPEVIESIQRKILPDDKLNSILDLTQYYTELKDMRSVPLFSLLSKYGAKHPAKFKIIRQKLVQYQLSTDDDKLQETARKARLDMRAGFREWIGDVQQVAVDIETGNEYTWDDVVIFEEDIKEDDKEKILLALKNTALIKEAVFLFSKGRLIQLDGIPPGGVWVSYLGTEHGKSVYRVSIQTRDHGGYDFALNLSIKMTYDEIVEEVEWLIRAGTVHDGQQLVEDFGGFWNDFGLWSEEFIHGQTTGKFLKLIARQKDEKMIERARHLWPFLIWSGISAYADFWHRTGRRLEIDDPSVENVIIPAHDYQTGTRIVSISARKKHENLLDMLLNFYKNFIEQTEEQYPFLKDISDWKYVFSAFPDTFGFKKGIDILRICCEELEDQKGTPNYEMMKKEFEKFKESIAHEGFIPRRLYFAIRRYHRWLELNHQATTQARAASLSELYITYALNELEDSYPETRTMFFYKTVFADSAADLRNNLKTIITELRDKTIKPDDLTIQISSLQKHIDLTDDEKFFLTRLSYPHVSPDDSAEIITLDSGGEARANLVVHREDLDGNGFNIREPINPKEIAKLHQLYMNNKLAVQFRPEHQFLIAVNERGYLIGGIYFYKVDDHVAHLEKIVVDTHYRKKGVSDLLMTEFFKRMKNANHELVTTGFFRPEYFYRFGFKIEHKYAGLVKDLTSLEFKTDLEEEI